MNQTTGLGKETQQQDRQTGSSEPAAEVLRTMVDNVPAMIGYWGTDLRNRFANATYTRWLGKSLDQVVGRSVQELFGIDFYTKYKPHLDAVLSGERQDYQRTMTRPDGGVEYQQVTYIPDLRDGKVNGFFVLTTDISELVLSQHALEAALHEKETLLKEVYHRVKNNLQVVQSLLNLQHRALEDGTARSGIQDMIQRVHAMVLLHEQLYRSDSLSAISLRRYVGDVLAQLAKTHEGPERNVSLHIDVVDMNIDLDNAMPLGLLLTELITNCYKHAFPARQAGQIRVEIRSHGEGLLILVSDDGVGFPPGFDPANVKTMGIRLVFALAHQLGGALSYSSEQSGVTARLDVPRL